MGVDIFREDELFGVYSARTAQCLFPRKSNPSRRRQRLKSIRPEHQGYRNLQIESIIRFLVSWNLNILC
jgi:hypothetical protein